MLLAPTRVMVRSAKVSSARESAPVWTALPSVTSSFKCAGRAATCGANRLTSRTTRVTRPTFLSAAVSSKIAPEPKSSTKPARGNEQSKIDFMVVSESKRKRESATDISDVIEAADFDKSYKDPALIQRRYSRAPRKDSWLDRVSSYHLSRPN